MVASLGVGSAVELARRAKRLGVPNRARVRVAMVGLGSIRYLYLSKVCHGWGPWQEARGAVGAPLEVVQLSAPLEVVQLSAPLEVVLGSDDASIA